MKTSGARAMWPLASRPRALFPFAPVPSPYTARDMENAVTTTAAETPLCAANKAVALTPARPALAVQNGVGEANKTPTRCAHCEEAGRARGARCAGVHCAKAPATRRLAVSRAQPRPLASQRGVLQGRRHDGRRAARVRARARTGRRPFRKS